MLVFSVIITGTSLPPVPLLVPFTREQPTLPRLGRTSTPLDHGPHPRQIDRSPRFRNPGSRDGTPLAALVEGLFNGEQGQKTLYALPDGHARLRLKSRIQTTSGLYSICTYCERVFMCIIVIVLSILEQKKLSMGEARNRGAPAPGSL